MLAGDEVIAGRRTLVSGRCGRGGEEWTPAPTWPTAVPPVLRRIASRQPALILKARQQGLACLEGGADREIWLAVAVFGSFWLIVNPRPGAIFLVTSPIVSSRHTPPRFCTGSDSHTGRGSREPSILCRQPRRKGSRVWRAMTTCCRGRTTFAPREAEDTQSCTLALRRARADSVGSAEYGGEGARKVGNAGRQ